jgi:hypothetical protein
MLKMKSMKAHFMQIGWSATIYNVWKQKNNVRQGNQILKEEKIALQMKWVVRSPVIAIGSLRDQGRMKNFVVAGVHS